MREVLFRGKVKNTNEWQYGDLRHWTKKSVGIHHQELHTTLRVIPETVGQYTGYKIDEIKVFENDIAKIHLEVSYLPHQDKVIDDIGVVCFDTDDLRYYVVSNTGKKYAMCYIKEIIGNLHDNPELLGDEQ